MALPVIAAKFAASGIARLMAYLVVAEGSVALIDHFTGDPEGDVQRALEQLSTTQQVEAQGQLALGQQQEEELQARFSKFNRIPGQALSQASFASEDAAALRGNQTLDTGVLDFVANKLNMNPQDLISRSSPERMGDYTGILRAANHNVPGN